MKKILIFTIFALILSFLNVQALDVDVVVTPIKNTVAPIQTATYNLQIKNNGVTDLSFDLIYLDIDWRVNPDRINVPALSAKNTQISLEPQPPYSENKPQVIRLIISTPDKSYRTEQLLDIRVLKYKEILDQSNDNLVIPDPTDPRKPTLIRLKIINDRDVSLDNVNIKLVSKLFEENTVINVGPSDTKLVDFPITFKEFTAFGSYSIQALVTYKNNVLANFTKDMRIGEYPKVTEIKSPRSGFLYTLTEITKTNEGNTISHEVYTRKLTSFEKRFTSTNPEPTSITKQDGGYLYAWEFDLQPKESKTISIKTNYRGFFAILIIIAILAIGFYTVTKRDITIKKKVASIQKEKDGSSIIKIVISVKNKGVAKLRNVKIMDRIPHLAEMPHEFGTAHPKVVKGVRGAQLIWEIVVLNPGEERVFSYKTKTRLQILGSAAIPSAIAKYNMGKRSLIVRSPPEKLFS